MINQFTVAGSITKVVEPKDDESSMLVHVRYGPRHIADTNKDTFVDEAVVRVRPLQQKMIEARDIYMYEGCSIVFQGEVQGTNKHYNELVAQYADQEDYGEGLAYCANSVIFLGKIIEVESIPGNKKVTLKVEVKNKQSGSDVFAETVFMRIDKAKFERITQSQCFDFDKVLTIHAGLQGKVSYKDGKAFRTAEIMINHMFPAYVL